MNDVNPQIKKVEKLSKVYKLINKEDDGECEDVSYWKVVKDLQNVTIDFQKAGMYLIY